MNTSETWLDEQRGLLLAFFIVLNLLYMSNPDDKDAINEQAEHMRGYLLDIQREAPEHGCTIDQCVALYQAVEADVRKRCAVPYNEAATVEQRLEACAAIVMTGYAAIHDISARHYYESSTCLVSTRPGALRVTLQLDGLNLFWRLEIDGKRPAIWHTYANIVCSNDPPDGEMFTTIQALEQFTDIQIDDLLFAMLQAWLILYSGQQIEQPLFLVPVD